MKTRSFIVALAAAVVLFASPAAGSAASSVMLRTNVVVDDDVIRLGDLFTNSGKYADTAIARSPIPGRRSVFDAEWLFRVARAFRLAWRPLSLDDRAVVDRASQVISREEIENHVLIALQGQGLEANTEFEMNNQSFRVYIPADEVPSVGVEDVNYNPRANYVTAVVVVPADSPAAQRFRISGKVHRIVSVPVLRSRLMPDDVIGKRDIDWVSARDDQLTPDTILDADNLVGMSPRRMIPTGRPVRSAEVDRPTLVSRRDLVTLKFVIPRMSLSARGRALENGAEGDSIRVVNLSSNVVVEGTVTGSGEVSVIPAAQQLASQ